MLEIHSATEKRLVGRVSSRDQLLAVDLDNSGRLDLIAWGGAQAPIVWLAQGESAWTQAEMSSRAAAVASVVLKIVWTSEPLIPA